jgi:hypothetical protein
MYTAITEKGASVQARISGINIVSFSFFRVEVF